jgi:hypothetical protein
LAIERIERDWWLSGDRAKVVWEGLRRPRGKGWARAHNWRGIRGAIMIMDVYRG